MPAVIVGYMFLFIFRPFEVWPQLAELRIERAYMLFALSVFVFKEKNEGVANKLHFYILALCALVILSPVFSPYPAATENQVQEYLKYLVFYFMLLYGIRTREQLEQVLIGFLGVMLVYEGKSLWEFLINGRHMFRMGIVRLIGVDEAFSDPNTFAASIAYSLPFAFMFLRYRSEIYSRRLVLTGVILLLAVSATCVVFTGSRSGQLAFLAVLLMEWTRAKRKILLAGFFAGVLVGVWSVMPAQYQGRFESIWKPEATDATAEESAQGRVEGIKDGFALAKKRPLFGFGAGTFGEARGLVGELQGLAAHSLYGQVMGELGLVGSMLLILISVSIWRQAAALRRDCVSGKTGPPSFYCLLSIAVAQTLLLLLFLGFSGHNLYRHTWLWIAAFIMLAVHFRAREQPVGGGTEERSVN